MENNIQQQAQVALAILIQGVDTAIERSGYTRKQIVDLDWAIKTLTGENRPAANGEKKVEKTTEKA